MLRILLVFTFGRMLGNLTDLSSGWADWGKKGQRNLLFKNLPLRNWRVKVGGPSSPSSLQATFASQQF